MTAISDGQRLLHVICNHDLSKRVGKRQQSFQIRSRLHKNPPSQELLSNHLSPASRPTQIGSRDPSHNPQILVESHLHITSSANMATRSNQNQPTTSPASLILVRKSRRTRNRSVNQTTYHGHATALFCRLPLSADAERDGLPDFVQRIVHHGSGDTTFALNGDRVHIVHIYEGSRTAQPDLFHAGPCFDDNDYAEWEGYNLGRISDAEGVEIFEDPSGDLVRETLWNGNCHYKDCLDGYIQCDDGFASGVSWMLQNLRPLKLDYVRKLENLRGLLFRTTGKTLCPYCMGLGLTIKLERLVVVSFTSCI